MPTRNLKPEEQWDRERLSIVFRNCKEIRCVKIKSLKWTLFYALFIPWGDATLCTAIFLMLDIDLDNIGLNRRIEFVNVPLLWKEVVALCLGRWGCWCCWQATLIKVWAPLCSTRFCFLKDETMVRKVIRKWRVCWKSQITNAFS